MLWIWRSVQLYSSIHTWNTFWCKIMIGPSVASCELLAYCLHRHAGVVRREVDRFSPLDSRT